MSDDVIRKGDLVMVVRGNPCGCPSQTIGKIGTVLSFDLSVGNMCCVVCGEQWEQRGAPAELSGFSEHPGSFFETSRLKKIPPLALPESTERETETLS